MAFVGNLSCADCGLTFTSRWGSSEGVDEYRCQNDHVVMVARTGAILMIDGVAPASAPRTLEESRGLCPRCRTELATGLLPVCPVCGGRDHEVLVEGTLY
jgi:hypothetical protein